MKIFETALAPNARRVRMFLAEKQIDMEYIEIDIKSGENLSTEYRSKNPFAKVPVLALDDGNYLSESVAICRYFEELHPKPALFGSSALDKAQIEMWQRRAELGFLMPVGMGFQHCTGFFKDRMTPNITWGEDCIKSAHKFLTLIEEHFVNHIYLAGDTFSIADITLLCTLDFAKVIEIRLDEKHPNIQRWYNLVNSRESARA